MEIKTRYLPPVFLRFGQQVLHFVVIPIFTFFFLILYKPFNLEEKLALPTGGFAFNATIIAAIVFLVLLIARMSLWGLRNVAKFKRSVYFVWCFSEIIICCLFVSLYVTLMSQGRYTYIDVLPAVIADLSAVLIFPYALLTLVLETNFVTRYVENEDEAEKIRFYDDKHKLKFVTKANSILYVQSEENYCNIYYMEGPSVKKFQLRSTMRAIEEPCSQRGIIRCHRSYFVNPKRVKALLKGREGIYTLQMDVNEVAEVPVSYRYYDDVAAQL